MKMHKEIIVFQCPHCEDVVLSIMDDFNLDFNYCECTHCAVQFSERIVRWNLIDPLTVCDLKAKRWRLSELLK